MSWVDCVVDNDFEIFTEFPFHIRRKSNGHIVSEFIDYRSNGYIRCRLGRKIYGKHRIVAEQFISNPYNLPAVDHINHDKTDYHIDNLRWVSHSENSKNKTRASFNTDIEYEYFDEIPLEDEDDAIIEVSEYGNHHFTELYFYNNYFYVFNGIQYRRLYINYDKRNGNAYVITADSNNKQTQIRYQKFKTLYLLN